ncbi:MAG: mannosyltransferase family protein [Solirubrobacteraceae bacterium]
MSSETAEQAIAQHPSSLAVSAGTGAQAHAWGKVEPAGVEAWGAGERARRGVALRDVWRALWVSRLLVWIGSIGAVASFGFGPVRHALNPPGITRGFGALGDLMAAPAARWDAAWYLVIANYGYRPQFGAMAASRTAFFPLYPLGVRLLSSLSLAPVIAGVLFSVAALTAGLYGLHRLMDSEAVRLGLGEGGESARLVVLLMVFAPMAFYFSAVYSESLYFALSVGVFLCARRGQWAKAAGLAALASATRSTGIVLMVPLVLLYLYGPRSDRGPDRVGGGRFTRGDGRSAEQSASVVRRSALWQAGSAMSSLRAAVTPRYRVRSNALWLALAPVGLCLYMAHLALAGGDALAPFHAEAVWKRDFAGPYGGVWDGAKAAYEGLRQIFSLQRHHVYFPPAGGSPFIDAGHNLLLFAFMLAAIPMTVGVLRLLPIAYGAYVLAALALPLSYPVAPQPLMSLPRFLLVLFPLNMWLAVRLVERPKMLTWAVLVGSGLAMMFFAGEFSTWHWVA